MTARRAAALLTLFVCGAMAGCSSTPPAVPPPPQPTPRHVVIERRPIPAPPEPRTAQLPALPEFTRPAPSQPAPMSPARPTPSIERPVTPTQPTTKHHEPAWLPNPVAEAKRRKEEGPWKYIVIHHSDSERGGAEAFEKFHRVVRGWSGGLGYDFVIGNGSLTPDGRVEVGGRWIRQEDGAHAGVEEYNKFGIGICLVGDFTKNPPSAAQMQALAKVVNFLCDRYRIPRDRKHIIGHGEIRNTQCPGPQFHWGDLMARVRQ
jgi:hypothetical protein